MGLGLGIFLLVVGAILAFAVQYDPAGLDLDTIGFILMGAGVLTLLLAVLMNTQRTNTTHREVIDAPEPRRRQGGPDGY